MILTNTPPDVYCSKENPALWGSTSLYYGSSDTPTIWDGSSH